jgi:hypothetical protein
MKMVTEGGSGDEAGRLSDQSLARWGRAARRRAGQFIKGPLPMSWIEKAAALPGKALALGLAVWFRSGITGGQVVLGVSALARFSVGRKAAYAALKALEGAGLVRVARKKGGRPRITLLPAPAATPAEE